MLRRPVLVIVVVALLCAIWGGAWLDYRAQARLHREEFTTMGDALAAAARGSIQLLFRGGRYDPEELQGAIAELRDGLRLEHVRLEAQGALMAQAPSDPPELDATVPFELSFEALHPRVGGRHGPGPPGLTEAPRSPLRLCIRLSRATLERRLRADLTRFVGLALALTIVLSVSLFAWSVRERSLRLALELGRTQEQLRGVDFLGRLGAGLAHETRNPLGLVRGFAQQLADGSATAARTRAIGETIVDEVDRTVARLDEFLLLSRPARLRREPFELHDLVQELARLLEPDLASVEASIELAPFTLAVDADREQARRLFMNLLLNAVQAVERRGRVRIELVSARDVHQVRIVDDGPGVPDELRATLFEPYVSGRRGGSGLGLAAR